MSHTTSPKSETIVRVILTIIVLFNAVIPIPAMAKPLSSSETSTSQPEGESNPSSDAEPVYHQPSAPIPSPSRFSSQADEKKPETPEKDVIEFSISTSKGEVGNNRNIVVNVVIRNSSETQIDNLAYYDKLETGLEFDSSTDTQVAYTSTDNTVSYKAGSLAAGEEIVFSYTLKAKNKKDGKLSIHNAEIEYELDGEMHAQTASLGFADSSSAVDADALIVVPDQTGDGWETAGRYSLYLGEEVLSQEAVVAITPAEASEAGPELQFDLELIQTTAPSTTTGGELREQDVTLGSVVETDFESPAYLEVNLDGVADLEKIPAGQEPYVATYDEEHDIWVKVPIVETDPATNSVTVEASHFSTWGAGLGNSLPQNGANVLLFDQPYTSLFTGSSRYSVPIWTPPGRAGMSPDISLSYSSATVDGVLGDVQAPWVGVGWNIDGIEIVRKIVTNEDGYGYSNDFALTLNGTVYDLTVDTDDDDQSHYYTKQSSFLYIERHNYALGNQKDENGDVPPNVTGEWWEVVTTDGTSYRLGWNNDSEQLALMYGYSCTGNPCRTPNAPYDSLGYAGKADNLVAMRWRVDRITDTHGNFISYAYTEEQPASGIAPFDRESYLEKISYTGFDGQAGSEGYEVDFVNAARSTTASVPGPGDVPVTFNVWDNLDSRYLDKIVVRCIETSACGSAGQDVRTYDFDYSLATVPNDNGTLTLTKIKISGVENVAGIENADAPDIKFTYQNLDNRAVTGTDKRYTYPRLQTINNGTGGVLTYTYENDGRGTNSWYNYRVKNVRAYDGRGTAALQEYAYTTPVYTGAASGYPTLGGLVGYTTVSEKQLDYDNSNAVLLETKHTFGTEGLDTGKELSTEWLDDTTVLKKTVNTYVTDNSKAPFSGWNYRYLYRTVNSVESYGNLTVSSQATYVHDPATGNLLLQTDYLGTAPYRKTYYEYYFSDYPVYILDKVSRVFVTITNDNDEDILTDTRYHYDGQINKAPTRGDLTLTQSRTPYVNNAGNLVSGTVDAVTEYDPYGNVVVSKQYTSYGSVNSNPTGNAQVTSTTYDGEFHTYPVAQFNPAYVTVDNPNGQFVETNYLFGLGVPYKVTDVNGWETTTTYDGLGRQRSITVPGMEDEAVWYDYPEPNSNGVIAAPYGVEMQILDTANGGKNYRSVWGIYDGLGRQIQMQVFDDDEDQVLVTNTEFNAQGAVSRQGSPYYAGTPQGHYITPAWTQFTSSEYDALGRAVKVTQPGDLVTRTEYDGFLTTAFDPNGQKIERGTDGFGRLAYVREFSDVNTIYAVTRYSYDQMDHLTTVTDAKNNVTELEYDWLGRKTRMVDPDMGEWLYEYYPTGTLSWQKDARGTILTFEYDALNRMTKKYADEVELAYYEYGSDKGQNIGMRTLMNDGSGTAAWAYSNYGRTVTETREIGDVSRTMTTVSDWLGRPQTVASLASPTATPDETLTYTYDALGRPKELTSSDSLVDLTYNALGQVTTQALGNGVSITNAYDTDNNRLASRTSTGIINFGYTYDSNGNITDIVDGKLNETHHYTYDFLNRLTAARANTSGNASDVKYDQYFTYDQVGNITQMNDWVIPGMTMQMGPASFAGIPSASQKDPLSSGTGVSAVSYRSPGFGFSGSASLALQNGDTPTPTPTQTPTSGLIFADGFESGNLSAWSSSATDSGDLSVSSSVALEGTYGMQAVIDDTTAIYAVNNSPTSEAVYRVGFQFDPNSVVIPANQGFSILYTTCASGSGYRLMLSDNTSGGYDLQLQARSDAATWIGGGYVEISDGPHVIEVELVAASAAGANDGTLKLWVDDTQVGVLTGLDNDTRLIESAYFGIDSVDTGTSGTIYYDGFESYGTLRAASPSTPTDTPTPTSTPTATFTPTNTGLPTNTPTPTSTPTSGLIFANGFESGNFTAWSSSATDSGDLSVSSSAALEGTYGMQAVIDDTTAIYAVNNSPTSEAVYRVGFQFDPNSVVIPANQGFSILYTTCASGSGYRLMLSDNTSGGYDLQLQARSDAATWIGGGYAEISDGPHVIEVELVTASAAGANDGTLKLWVDDTQVGALTGLDNDTRLIESAYFGIDSVDTGTSGTIYYDGFESYRTLRATSPSTPTDTPTPTHTPTPAGTSTSTRTPTPTGTSTSTHTPAVTNTHQPTNTPAASWSDVDEYTMAMLHMDGADGDTDFIDETGKTWTAIGNAQIDAAQRKFGSGAALFDGTGSHLTTDDSNDFNVGSGDFTVDFWFRKNVNGINQAAFGQMNASPSATTTGLVGYSSLTSNVISIRFYAGSTLYTYNGTKAITDTEWHHYAAVRDGNDLRLFLDGEMQSDDPVDVTGLVINDSPSKFSVGGVGEYAGNYTNGWIDEFRFSKGVARWTADFTPPAYPYGMGPVPSPINTKTPTRTPTATITPTAPLYTYTPTRTSTATKTSTSTQTPTPTDAYAGSMLAYWSFDSASVTGTKVSDVAPGDTTSNDLTLNGAVIGTPAEWNQAIYFDGINQYAGAADQAEIKTNGSFTVSAWVNPASGAVNHTQNILIKGETYRDYGLLIVSSAGTPTPTADPGTVGHNGSVAFVVGDLDPDTLYGPVLTAGDWTMVTGVYDATADQTRLYINGDLVAVQEITGGTLFANTGALTFSSSNENMAYNGGLDDVRFYHRALTGDEIEHLLGVSVPTATPTPTLNLSQTATATSTPTATGTPTPVSPSPTALSPLGTGDDGDLEIADNEIFNLNVGTHQNGRDCADGVAYNVLHLSETGALLDAPTPSPTPTGTAFTHTPTPTSTVVPAIPLLSSCIEEGDEVLLIKLAGGSGSSYNAGSHEFLRVATVGVNTVSFTTPKLKWYGSGWRNDLNIGVGTDQMRVMLMRVPNYEDVTVNTGGTLTAAAFDGKKYGVVVFRVQGSLIGGGTISANELGHEGSEGYGKGGNGTQGYGGGAGYGTRGETVYGGSGGFSYGSSQLDAIFLGSGGGTGSTQENTYAGGNGGGIILVTGNVIGFTGNISANGATGGGSGQRGGSGSGGSVRIEGSQVSLGAITAVGGSGGAGGDGGDGRIVIYPYNPNRNTNPAAYDPSAMSTTATPSPLWGTGADGDLKVPTQTTFNIAIDNSNVHACTDGGDGVTYAITSLGDSYAKIAVLPTTTVTPAPTPDVNCLQPGDEILLAHHVGSGPNVGKYEFLKVGSVAGDIVYFASPKVNFYGVNATDDSGIGTAASSQQVRLQRVPNYDTVTVNGTLKTDTNLVFRVLGHLQGGGEIQADGTGSSTLGKGGDGSANHHGGGAGFGTAGTAVPGNGSAGSAYGSLQNTEFFQGSVGGSSGPHVDGQEVDGGTGGGKGGGAIWIFANNINFTGNVSADGATGGVDTDYNLYGGGGSGGSVHLESNTVALNTISIDGGAGGDSGAGAGGEGRIAVYYLTPTFSGNLVTNTVNIHVQQGTPVPPTATTTATATPGFDEYVMSLLEMDGNDASTTFEDKRTNKTWTPFGSAQIDTEYSKFGGASAKFDGSGDYVTTDDSEDFNVGSGDFTVDFWFRKNVNSTNQAAFGQMNSTANYGGLYGYTSLTNNKIMAAFYSGTTAYSVTSTTTVVDTNWHHYAVARDGNYLRLFLDGKLEGTLDVSGLTINNSTNKFSVGRMGDYNGYYSNGWIDEFRFSKGVARWKASFTPPTQAYFSDDYVPATQTAIPTAGWVEKRYSYPTSEATGTPPPRPHAVTSLDVTGSETFENTYEYDANGNMTCRAEYSEEAEQVVTYQQEYNAENRISAIYRMNGTCAGGTIAEAWYFTYDGDGTRTVTVHDKKDSSDMEVSAYYFGGAYEVTGTGAFQNDVLSGLAVAAVKNYYSFNGQTVAMRDEDGLQYFLTDHLGSVVAVTDETGTLTSQQRYLPFGGERKDVGNISQTDLGYTGQRLLDNRDGTAQDPGMGGIMDYRARFYSPALGRFLQPDTLIPDAQNPQAWNRFSYVKNNPVNFNDPSGHIACPTNGYFPGCGDPTTDTAYDSNGISEKLSELDLLGKTEEAMNYVTASECTEYTCTYSTQLPQAMMHKYNEYCGGGAWSVKCVQSFWGYFEGVLNADRSGFTSYDFTITNDLAAAIIDNQQNSNGTYNPHGTFTNDGQGCRGNKLYCDWANFSIPTGDLFIATAGIPNCNSRGPDCLLEGSESYSIWVHYQKAYDKYFIVMDVDAHDKYCNGIYSKEPYNFCYH